MLTQLGMQRCRYSPLHTHKGPQSSIVVFWQRIYPGLTVTPNDTWSRLFTIYKVTPCHYSAAASSEDSTQFISKLISRQLASRNSTAFLFKTTVVEVTLRLTSVIQSVLVSSPIWAHDKIFIYHCLTITVLLLWVALSDKRTGTVLFCRTLPYNHFARTQRKTQPLLKRCVYWSDA
jgi:hypothetical protein